MATSRPRPKSNVSWVIFTLLGFGIITISILISCFFCHKNFFSWWTLGIVIVSLAIAWFSSSSGKQSDYDGYV
jgi:hypothetical protein